MCSLQPSRSMRESTAASAAVGSRGDGPHEALANRNHSGVALVCEWLAEMLHTLPDLYGQHVGPG